MWKVEPISDNMTKVKLSVRRKNKDTGEYTTEFSWPVLFCGTATANQAARLCEKDRIKLGNVDVLTKYDKEKKTTHFGLRVYSFEPVGVSLNSTSSSQSSAD